MESYFWGHKDEKEENLELTMKMNIFFGKEKPAFQNMLEKTNFIKNNNIFLFSNETNEKTILREGQKQENSNRKIDDNFNKDNKDNNKISTFKYIPSLPPTNIKDIIDPFTISNSCETTISNFGEIKTKNNLFNINQTNSISPIYINLLPEVKYNPVPEREYYDDILSGLLIEEENNLDYKKCLYIDYQKGLDNKKRAELISFIYKMSKLYNFKTRTTFLAVQTMDRFLCKEKIDPEYYNLLCICSLVIASKFNEIYYPAFKDIIPYFSEGNYTVKQALTMELLILKTINYNLFPIFPMYFFDLISQKCDLNNIEYYLGCLMIELIQFDFYLYPYKNSVLAQTVFCKVINLTKRISGEPLEILKNIFSEEKLSLDKENINLIQNASIVIDELLHNLNADYFRDIYQKYSQPDILGNSINYFLNM